MLNANHRLAFVGALLLPLLLSAQVGSKVSKYGRSVPVGLDLIRGGDMCGGISVKVEGGDFFEGLRGENTTHGRIFYKKSQLVTLFPNELRVMINTFATPCVGPADPHQSGVGVQPEFLINEPFIKSLQFQAFWKRGFDMRKADLGMFSAGASRLAGYRFGRNAVGWEYEARVSCPAIPLTDSLVIDILSPSGARVSRFALRL